MSENDRIIDILGHIEDNQRKAMEIQQQHLQIAQAQLDRSNKTIQESIELQRIAVSRQAQMTKFVVPIIVALLVVLGYLLVKWNVL